jgi:hypothetical protein
MATLLDLTNRVKGEMGLSTGEYTVTIKGGAITDFANSSGALLCTSASHGLETGEYVAITDTTDYNTGAAGLVVTKIDDNSFTVADTFTNTSGANSAGNWVAIIAGDALVVNDVKISFLHDADETLEQCLVYLDAANGKNGVATLIKDWVNGIFAQNVTGSSVSATSSSNVVTITGASRVFTVAVATRAITAAGTIAEQLNKACVIGTVSTEDEPPSTSDIFQFIKDGQYDLLNKLHENALVKDSSSAVTTGGDLVKTIEFTNTSYVNLNRVDLGSITHYTGSSNVAVDILKIIDVSYKSNTLSSSTFTEVDSKERAEKVPFDLLQDIRGGNHSFYKVEDYSDVTPIPKFYTVMGNILELSHKLSAATATQNLSVLALTKPNEAFTTECSFGEHLQELLVMYAKAKSYELINRFDISQAITNEYNQLIGVINLKHSNKDVASFEKELPK